MPTRFADASSEVALAGADGRRAVELLAAAKRSGVSLLTDLTGRAVRRLLADPDPAVVPVLFGDDELDELAESLAAAIATADLLGRVRVRERARLAEARGRNGNGNGNGTVRTFADAGDDAFAAFDEPPPVMPPAEAVGYFRRLVPALGNDPMRYGPLLERHAFTLAVAADQVLLDRVKAAILDQLAGRTGDATAAVDAILDAAGVGPRNPQYGELITRTSVMDAYNQGAMAELQTPEMQDAFPVYKYEGIRDGRQGKDHEIHFDRYYPSSRPFHDVRGPRVFNCRCSFTPVFFREWEELQRRGARLEL